MQINALRAMVQETLGEYCEAKLVRVLLVCPASSTQLIKLRTIDQIPVTSKLELSCAVNVGSSETVYQTNE